MRFQKRKSDREKEVATRDNNGDTEGVSEGEDMDSEAGSEDDDDD